MQAHLDHIQSSPLQSCRRIPSLVLRSQASLFSSISPVSHVYICSSNMVFGTGSGSRSVIIDVVVISYC